MGDRGGKSKAAVVTLVFALSGTADKETLQPVKAGWEKREDTTVYRVVFNQEEQYSIWPADRQLPLGWYDAGKSGLKEECLEYIKAVWTDMRPLSLRRKMEELERGVAWHPPKPTIACAEPLPLTLVYHPTTPSLIFTYRPEPPSVNDDQRGGE